MPRLYALAAVVALAACAKQDSAPDSTAVALAGDPIAPQAVTVTARDFAFTAPDTLKAGITAFRLVNEGTALHHVMLIRLDSGKTIADVEAALRNPGPPPRWMVSVGGPNAPAPKAESNATIDLVPGNYAMMCFVDMPGGVPHFAKGMIKAVTVVPATGATAAAPVATDSITLDDYMFKLSRPLAAGRHTFRVVSNAAQEHEVELVKLAPGKTVQDMLAWIAKPNGPPPGTAIGGTTPSPTGQPTWFDADLSAGTYAMICFVPASDGKPHFQHGMVLSQVVQ